jgi:hypothetical protein
MNYNNESEKTIYLLYEQHASEVYRYSRLTSGDGNAAKERDYGNGGYVKAVYVGDKAPH